MFEQRRNFFMVCLMAIAFSNIVMVSALSSGSEKQGGQYYIVRPGDTLAKIAKKFYGDAMKYTEIFAVNRGIIDAPDKIYPGQKLKIPDAIAAKPEDNKALVTRYFEEGWNQQNLEVIEALSSANFIWHQLWQQPPKNKDVVGIEAIKENIATIFESIPDLHITIEDLIAEGDRVATRQTYRGTYRPTGKSFKVTGMYFARVADGKLVESWEEWNRFGFQIQVAPSSRPVVQNEQASRSIAPRQQAASGEPDDNKALVIRYIEEGWNQRKLEVIEALSSADFVRHRLSLQPPKDIVGIEAVKEHFAAVFEEVPNAHITIEDLIAEGDKVAMRQTYRGTFRPTGKLIKVTGMNFARVAGGKLVELWEELDVFGLRVQAGLARPEETREEDSR